MINKQKLWFLTLFSLIMVLSVYYVTMPSEVLNTKNDVNSTTPVVSIKNEDELSVLKELNYDERLKEMETLKQVLTNVDSSVEDKNNAYEKLQLIEKTEAKEDKIENKIKDQFKLDSFVKIDNNQIRVVIKSNEHSFELANNIIRSVQEEFTEKMYISVKFQ